MINSLGDVQSILVVGGTSEIGICTVLEIGERKHLRRIILAGRDSVALSKQSSEFVRKFPDADVVIAVIDLLESGAIHQKIDALFEQFQIDVVLLTAGVLPEMDDIMVDPATTVNSAKVNFLGQLEAGTSALAGFRKQGSGVLVVVSSVAVERPRRDNYVYGAAKAGLDAWANGAADALVGSGVRVVVVRPGMVRTRMSHMLPEAPMACDPEDVARAIRKNLTKGPVVVWVPGKIRWLMMILRHLPRPIFRRLSPVGKPKPPR